MIVTADYSTTGNGGRTSSVKGVFILRCQPPLLWAVGPRSLLSYFVIEFAVTYRWATASALSAESIQRNSCFAGMRGLDVFRADQC